MNQVRPVPMAVKAALCHVREHHPEVTQVTFDGDLRWCYGNEQGDIPAFRDAIDVGLLEDAADAVPEWPVTYTLAEITMLPEMVILPDGFNGHAGRFYSNPAEIDGDLVKLSCAEPGREHMFTWRDWSTVQEAMVAQGRCDRAQDATNALGLGRPDGQDYDGSYVQSKCTECNESDSECLCGEVHAQALEHHEFAFDCTLTAAIRVNAATRGEAEQLLRTLMDAADCNGGTWPNGDPVLFEASINDSPLELYEIDGEEVDKVARSTWDDNEVQFPRLLAEIVATQAGLDLQALAQAMDLTLAEVNSLFERAHDVWEAHKENAARCCVPI